MRTAEVIRDIANSVTPMLSWTADYPSAHSSMKFPGVAYNIKCTVCLDSGISSAYEGKSGKCLFERGKKHLSEFQSGLSTNVMVIHNRML